MILSTQLRAHAAGGLPGQASAFGTAFWWSLGFTVMAMFPALALPRRRNESGHLQNATGPNTTEPGITKNHPIADRAS